LARILIFLIILKTSAAFSQPVLLPSIGLNGIPADNDSVCNIPFYTGSFYTSGLQAGDTAFDFTLYNAGGDSLHLGSALSQGRPVLLIAGSYTCPVYRGKVQVINDLVNTYAGLLDVYIIYTLEAHPYIDTSVYFGYVNTTTQNINAGILYRQPVTYGERKTVIADMLNDINTQADVFIDGPCNNWWTVYGPAPNNSYLIDTNGIIFSKHGWFDKFPDNIYCDIDSLLGTTSGNCVVAGGNSTFTFQQTSADTIYGVAGSTLSVDGQLINNSSQDLLIYGRRLANNIPSDWGSSMCIDVCYSTTTDSVTFVLPAFTTQDVHVYFYTSSSIDTGHVRVGFRNLNNPANDTFTNAFGITTGPVGIREFTNEKVLIYPNPAISELNILNIQANHFTAEIYDATGKLFIREEDNPVINISSLSAGIYFIKLRAGNSNIYQKVIISDH
jgi:hypothetical protein